VSGFEAVSLRQPGITTTARSSTSSSSPPYVSPSVTRSEPSSCGCESAETIRSRFPVSTTSRPSRSFARSGSSTPCSCRLVPVAPLPTAPGAEAASAEERAAPDAALSATATPPPSPYP
jgi:hypothetical protein